MKSVIDALVIGVYLLGFAYGGHWALKTAYYKIQYLALEKAARGLPKMETISQQLTGKKLDF